MPGGAGHNQTFISSIGEIGLEPAALGIVKKIESVDPEEQFSFLWGFFLLIYLNTYLHEPVRHRECNFTKSYVPMFEVESKINVFSCIHLCSPFVF